ncbi:hypothetical protein SAXI111661_08175 [Saccharomonospora xinjiangensis]|uniref:hypothetical protein n=1 Tax=Saccharomonospora xinjiangensis TaxID=75294 RepID=UPI00106FF001|nr:hypothetical protein [Saccharomonospora xinjiangensis]QBQ61594.1 hypothetical protein EYD13_16245 [Saccharomonospora xinjiangensis]
MIVCWVAGLGLLAGCAGEDLAKENFERTTVKAEPGTGQGQVPTGPIDDPAVELATLRTVDACGLLGDDVAGNLTPQEEPSSSGWGLCSRSFIDAGGKPIRVLLELGEGSVFADQATSNVGGLPLVQTAIDDTSCFSTAVTQRDPDVGISVLADHEQGGGDPCQSSYLVLEGVLGTLRANPPTLTPQEGSLLTVDLCESLASEEFGGVLGTDEEEARLLPGGLHFCQLSQDDFVVYANARVAYPVAPIEGTKEVELAKGITGVQQPGTTDTAECDVSWNHLGLSEHEAEVITVSYYDYTEEADVDAACQRVTELAEAMVKTLP